MMNSPQVRLHAAAGAPVVHSPPDTRYRQAYVQPTTNHPDTLQNHRPSYQSGYADSDVKETHLVSPAYDAGYPNPNLRARSPAGHLRAFSEDTTLSTFLANTFSTAKKLIQARVPQDKLGSSLSAEGSSSAWGIPSASTIGFVFLCCLWYLSSAFSSNTGKTIMTQFRYPVTLTFVQFAFVSGYSVLCLAAREQLALKGASHSQLHHARRPSLSTTGGWGIRRPSRAHFYGTFMMSLFQIAGHVFSSMAIARVPVSTVHTIKALSPLFTVASYALLFKVRYSPPTYVALVPLTLGVMLACSFNIRANAVGFLCALGSTVIFVSQNIFSKKLLPKESSTGLHDQSSGGANSAKLDKLNLLFYSSGMAFVLMIPIWLYTDGGLLLSAWLNGDPVGKTPIASVSSLIFSFCLNGSVHFGQNLLAFSLLARTSPVTYSIASLVKRIAVICLAIVWSGQKVSFLQAIGMTMTFGGLWLYNRAKSDVDKGERKRGQQEKRAEMFLPTSLDDVRTDTPPPPGQQPNGTLFSPTYSPSQGYAQAKGVEEIPLTRNRSLAGQHQQPFPPPPQTQNTAISIGATGTGTRYI